MAVISLLSTMVLPLRYCKFGTLQYCVVRPATTLIAMLLDLAGCYHESELDFHYGYVYILIIMNISIGYAFIVLASFYTAMKTKLKPFEPVGKFLCIKFVIFFAFWQSVVITGLVKIGWITGFGGYSARQVSTGLQDFLICVEMFFAAVAFTYTFGYEPFTEGYVNPKLASLHEAEYDEENAAAMEYFMRATSNDLRNDSSDGSHGAGGGKRSSSGESLVPGGKRVTFVSPTVDPQQPHGALDGSSNVKAKKSVGLQNMVRSSRNIGFPFPVSRSAGASKQKPGGGASAGKTNAQAGKNYQLVEMNPGDTQHAAGAATYNKMHGTYSAPQEPRRIGGYPSGATGDRRHEQSVSQSAAPASSHAGELLNKHFAANAAIRDFNETMPVLVLPSGFEMSRGLVVNSDPEARLRALEEENRRLSETDS
jgi:hypothetical protein